MNSPLGGSANPWNVPNLLTSLRLLLSVVLFVLIDWAQQLALRGTPDQSRNLYLVSTGVFLLAAATDWVDGYWARRYGQVTKLGRVFDPFVDKVVVCGTFIFLVNVKGSEVYAWMAVIVVARELLVTALRGHVEQMGIDFSANMAGKVKMVVQCAAAATSLGLLGLAPAGEGPAWLRSTLIYLLWAAVLITIYSGAGYVISAVRHMRRG